jgi:hypothetical protein
MTPEIKNKLEISMPFGGESGIRTHDTVSRIHAFQASAFSHSAISPKPANPAGRSAQYSGGLLPDNPRLPPQGRNLFHAKPLSKRS